MEFDCIKQGDCLELMKKIPDSCIDLIVTSPPYDDLRTYNGNVDQWCFEKFQRIAEELYRITKEGGTMVWIVADSVRDGDESGVSFRQALMFKKIGFKLKDTMIYIKNGGINAGALNAYQQKFEYMFVLTKGKQKTCNLLRDRPNKYVENRVKRKKQKDGTYKEQHFRASKYGVRYNYWIYDTGAGKSTTDEFAFEHPAIFPEKLAEDHILSWSNEGDVIFDPFLGSGTTAKMAVLNKRHYVGCELDSNYFRIACQRLDAAEKKMKQKAIEGEQDGDKA